MMAAANSPTTIANTVRKTAREATARDAPRPISHQRIGLTVMVSTRARKTGPMMFGIARIPATATTIDARPSRMIRPLGTL